MDPTFLPAWRLAELVRGGAIGCVELLDHFIARVEALDGATNAVVVRDFDRAREQARTLDRQRAEGRTAPLLGVPMTVKESFGVAGLHSTWGFEEHRNHVAHEDALAVKRLKAAGAVIFGKTNVPVGLQDWQSYNPIYGTTNNPWDAAHTPGGSSGGGAAAVAAGLTGLEIGSDIGGSVRVPAHYCGLFGHKPTWGLCPTRGHALAVSASMTDISVIGPLARSAEDLTLVLDAIAGPDEAETAAQTPLPPPRAMRPSDLRVAVWSGEKGQETDEEVTAAIEAVADFMASKGAKVNRIVRPEFDPTEAYHLYLKMLATALSARQNEETLHLWREGKAAYPADDMSASAIQVRTVDMTHREWLRLNERRFHIRRAWGAFFHGWDVLLCPPIATAALPHRQDGETWQRRITINGREISYNDMLFWPGVTCAFHLPASVAPIGMTKAGLPIGVQIVGPLYGDRTTIHVAGLLEQHWRQFVAPPGWGSQTDQRA